jgi:tRNA(fMet)-specific endonuclease VapC
MNPAILDSDTISELLKKRNPVVDSHASAYLSAHPKFTFSAMSRFEVRRGLVVKGAAALLTKFDTFAANAVIFPIDDAVLEKALELWVIGRRGGWPHEDADLIIGATALVLVRDLVTGNTSHYDWMPGIRLVDWRNP